MSPTSTQPREPKSERLELRVAASAKEAIRRASAISGMSAGDLAYDAARRVLEEHERMVLAGADRDLFLSAIADPPAPTPALVEAMRRHKSAVG